MMRKYLRLVVVMAGAVVALGSVAACSDDSTASAPITSDPVTTTSMYAAASGSSSAPSSATAEQPASTPGSRTSGASRSLPATAPNTAVRPSGDFASPDGQPLDDKAKRYLVALRNSNVVFLGDTDNSIALTLAQYVCDAQRKNTDPVTTKGYVTALVAPGTENTQQANAKADKVIKAAQENYC